jgi:hypothetical protein
MTFEYEPQPEETKEPVAELYEFVGGPGLCLAVNTTCGKKVWFYPDGDIDIQNSSWDEAPIKKFYSGDKITITF